MSEFVYKIGGQRTGPAPKIRKLGAIAKGMESSPVILDGQLLLTESCVPDETCDKQYIRVRNTVTGEFSPPFGPDHYFASAYAENGTLYVFATCRIDDKPLNMYQSNDQSTWHDPRGGHSIRMYRSRDFKTWDEKDIITIPRWRLWNTSVCKGPDGYVMAIEVKGLDNAITSGIDPSAPEVGAWFTSFFARSKDMEHWEMMPDECCYTRDRYNACPALRFSRGWYYMMCTEALPCARYAPYIYRTKNFKDWEVGIHNPVMMWGDDDRVPKAGVTFDAETMDLLEHGLNINASDVDFCEQNGKTRIFYNNGDQMTYCFICEAEYDGPMDEFLEAFFL